MASSERSSAAPVHEWARLPGRRSRRVSLGMIAVTGMAPLGATGVLVALLDDYLPLVLGLPLVGLLTAILLETRAVLVLTDRCFRRSTRRIVLLLAVSLVAWLLVGALLTIVMFILTAVSIRDAAPALAAFILAWAAGSAAYLVSSAALLYAHRKRDAELAAGSPGKGDSEGPESGT